MKLLQFAINIIYIFLNGHVESRNICETKYRYSRLCWDESKIFRFQQRMISNARTEVFGPILTILKDYLSMYQLEYDENDMGFYKSYFGSVRVTLPSNSNNMQNVIYYRIFKNANDYIRTVLYKFANLIHYFSSENISVVEEKYHEAISEDCIGDDCSHPFLTQEAVFRRVSQHSYGNDIIFTFVRNPLTRFISAVSEV